MPTANPLSFSDLLEKIAAALPPDQAAYLVGGAVRDALLQRVTHDLDFAMPGEDVLTVSRRLADRIGAAFYPLDEERDTGRLVIVRPDGSRQMLDFAALRGPDLESDLRARDFTINAMAVDVRQPQSLIDPLGGAADLLGKRLSACSATAFTDDPLRILHVGEERQDWMVVGRDG